VIGEPVTEPLTGWLTPRLWPSKPCAEKTLVTVPPIHQLGRRAVPPDTARGAVVIPGIRAELVPDLVVAAFFEVFSAPLLAIE